jgi:NodT family efflux transporter outer membrane factor (OMF) lipoprotein
MSFGSRRPGPIQRAASLLSFCALAGVALMQAGCTTSLKDYVHNGYKVGPNFQCPAAALPERWIDENDPHVAKGAPNLASWWDVFGDPVLTNLIQQANARNLSLLEAGLLIEQSRMQQNIAFSELLPQAQNMTSGFAHGQLSRNAANFPAGGPAFGTALAPSAAAGALSTPSTPINGAGSFGAGAAAAGTTTTPGTSPLLNSAVGSGGAGVGVPVGTSRFFDNWGSSLNLSWELDFWGAFRRNLEAAKANLNQSMHNYDEMVVQFLANVATAYVEVRIFQRRLELARQNVALQEPLVDTLSKQYQAGIATSKPAYFQLKSNLDNTRALIPPLEVALRQANNSLCSLLGIPMKDLLGELGDATIPDPKDPRKRVVRIPRALDDTIALAIPGEALLQRPDVLAMEQQLRIQSAQIGISEAQLLPHIGINGTIGLAADRFSLMFNQQSLISSVGPSLTWNILNYGRLMANVRIQNVKYQQFVMAYQQTLLNANQDAENSIVAYLQSLDQAKFLTGSANDAVEVTDYYYGQFDIGYLPQGVTSLTYYNQIFTAINFRVTQQDAAAQAEGNIALNLILLYRALGGGWQIRMQHGQGASAHGHGASAHGHGASAKVSSNEAGRPPISPLTALSGDGPNEPLPPLPGNPALPDALPATETMPRVGREN